MMVDLHRPKDDNKDKLMSGVEEEECGNKLLSRSCSSVLSALDFRSLGLNLT